MSIVNIWPAILISGRLRPRARRCRSPGSTQCRSRICGRPFGYPDDWAPERAAADHRDRPSLTLHPSVHHRRRWRAGGLCAGLDQARGVRASLAEDPDPVRAAFIVRRFIRAALIWHGRSNAWSLFVWKQPWHPPWCECGWKCQLERRTDTFRDQHAAIQQSRCNAARLTIRCPKYLGSVTAWKLAAI